MNRGRQRLILGVVAMCAAYAGVARADNVVVLPRPGQVGIEAQGGYGTLLEGGNLGEVFGSGPTFGVRLRYRMRYERGLGLSFEHHSLDARVAPHPDSAFAPTKLSMIVSGLEFYQMFGTRTRTTKMLMVGVGLAQYRTELNDGETELSGPTSGDGLYVSAGAGIERFFYRSMAIDLSTRYFAVFKDGKTNNDIQAAIGLIYYASY